MLLVWLSEVKRINFKIKTTPMYEITISIGIMLIRFTNTENESSNSNTMKWYSM